MNQRIHFSEDSATRVADPLWFGADDVLLSHSFEQQPEDIRRFIAESQQWLSNKREFVRLTSLDAEAIAAHLGGLSEEDLKLRFGQTMTRAALNRYVDSINFNRDIVLGAVQDERVVALCHMAVFHEKGFPVGELGISLDEGQRGKGLASRLLALCFSEAALRKLTKLYIIYLRHNRPMAALCRKFSATLDIDGDEVTACMKVHGSSDANWVAERFIADGRLEVLEKTPTDPKGTVVLVHGAGGDAWQWRQNFIPFLAGQGYRALAVSLRSHGRSAKAPAAYSVDDFVQDVVTLLEAEGPDTILVGHSLGGFVVQKVLEQRPARKAVLLGAVPPSGLRDERLSQAKIALKHSCGRQVLDEAMRDYAPVATHRITTPVVVVGGRYDKVIPRELVEETAQQYGTEPIWMENSGHALMLSADWRRAADLVLA